MNTTRRHPRTMQEAFGPYTDGKLQPLPSRRTTGQRVADVIFATALGVCGAALLVHFLAR